MFLISTSLPGVCPQSRVGKNLSEMFPIRNGLKQGDALSPLLFNYAIKRVQVNEDGLKLMARISFWLMPMMLTYWEEAYIL
jgi:hypothetical protein